MKKFVFGTLILLAAAAVSHAAAQKPNIVLIISDDHGWRDSSCYGNPDVRTPNLDKLAAEGMRFTYAFSASPLCSPARSVIDTGLMPFRNGGHVFGGPIAPGTKTIAHYLHALGYQTANLGKFSKGPASAFGYDFVKESWKPGHDDDLVDAVGTFLTNRRKDRPLFLEINLGDTHMAMVNGRFAWAKNKRFDPAKLKLPGHLIDTKEMREALADYYTAAETLDANMGKIMASLEKNGYSGNTLTLYTSDQGPNFPFAKWCLYDEGLRIPFIAKWPGVIQPHTVTDAMFSHADIVPTLVAAAGGQPPRNTDGWNAMPVLKGRAKELHGAVFGSHTGQYKDYPAWLATWNPNRSIRTRQYQYILNLNPDRQFMCHIAARDPAKQLIYITPWWESWVNAAKTNDVANRRVDQFHHRPQHELYDLAKDPFQTNNVADRPEYAATLKSLQTRLATWRRQQGDAVPVYLKDTYVPPERPARPAKRAPNVKKQSNLPVDMPKKGKLK